jgi:hypothetical protein
MREYLYGEAVAAVRGAVAVSGVFITCRGSRSVLKDETGVFHIVATRHLVSHVELEAFESKSHT